MFPLHSSAFHQGHCQLPLQKNVYSSIPELNESLEFLFLPISSLLLYRYARNRVQQSLRLRELCCVSA